MVSFVAGDLMDVHGECERGAEEDIDVDRLITIVNMGIDQSLTMAIGKVGFGRSGQPTIL